MCVSVWITAAAATAKPVQNLPVHRQAASGRLTALPQHGAAYTHICLTWFLFVFCACRNLAGHSTVTGDLPTEWYNQTAFPNLVYLKLKGTQIRPSFLAGKLKWNGERCFCVLKLAVGSASGGSLTLSHVMCANLNICPKAWPAFAYM